MNELICGASGPKWVARVDPRSRLIAVFVFCVLVGILRAWEALWAAMIASVISALAAGRSPRSVAGQVLSVTLALTPLLATVPFSTPGEVWKKWGKFSITREGLVVSGQILLKVNCLVVFTTSLLRSVDEIRMGHALAHLRIPKKLALLLTFVYRYLTVIFYEYESLRRSMRARAFRARLNMHTLRTFGYLVAVLVARSYDRSQRILAAMKCRGFTGEFPLLFHFRYGIPDLVFLAVFVLILVIFAWLEWRP